MDTVALVKVGKNIKQALIQGIKLIGGFQTVKSPVLIKPNICTISDATGHSVTDVRVVEALIELLNKEYQNLSIRIIESDSQSKFADRAYVKFGYKRLEEKMQSSGFDVSLVNLSQSSITPVPFEGNYFLNPELPEPITGFGYFISVAVAKTHYLTFLTGVLKNQFGLLPRKDQGFYHSHIDDVVVDLNRIVRPNLCVVDARVGIEGWNGPKTRDLNAFIIGHQPASVDSIMGQIMGFHPERINHVVEASKYELGTLKPSVKGENLAAMKVQFDPPENK